MSLENKGIEMFYLLGSCSVRAMVDEERARHICRAIGIMRARVDEVGGIIFNDGALLAVGDIVHDGGIFPAGRDCRKAGLLEGGVALPICADHVGGVMFADAVRRLLLKPCKKLRQGNGVSNMGLGAPVNFR